MNPDFAERYYRLEDGHPWSVGRRDIVLRMLGTLNIPKNARILEPGCGSGALLQALKNVGYQNCTGIDLSPLAIEHAARRGLEDVQVMDASTTSFEDESFDVVIASDVLEHILDEQAALAEWKRLIPPGGLILCFVPAFAFLWSEHDTANHHYRRYSRSMLESVVRNSGFEVERLGYWNAWLFAPMTAIRAVRRVVARRRNLKRSDDFQPMSAGMAQVFNAVFRAENRLIESGIDFPIGVSTYAILRKPLAP